MNSWGVACLRIISQDGIEIGQKFGMLTVINNAEPLITGKGYKYERFLCRCDDGNLLPMTSEEIEIIHKYIKKYNIKEHRHVLPLA